jgi:hypothetical protein
VPWTEKIILNMCDVEKKLNSCQHTLLVQDGPGESCHAVFPIVVYIVKFQEFMCFIPSFNYCQISRHVNLADIYNNVCYAAIRPQRILNIS